MRLYVSPFRLLSICDFPITSKVGANVLDDSFLSELLIYFSLYLLLVMTDLSPLRFLLMLLPDTEQLNMGYHSIVIGPVLLSSSVCRISLFKQAYSANGCLGVDNQIVGGVI